MVFRSHFTKKFLSFILFVSVSFSVLPMHAMLGNSVTVSFGAENEQNQNGMANKALTQIMQALHNQQTADNVINSMPNQYQDMQTVITKNENDELQLDRLVSTLGRPETSFGFTGLKWLLLPVTDLNEIRRRQTIVRSLVQDEKLFNQLQEALCNVKKGEAALLDYWKKDFELHKNAETIFNFKLIEPLNKSSLALEGSASFELIQAISSLLKLHITTFIEQILLTSLVDPQMSIQSLSTNLSSAWRNSFRFLDPRRHMFNANRNDVNNIEKNIHDAALQPGGAHNLDGSQRMHVLGGGSLGDRIKYIKDCWAVGDRRSVYGGLVLSGLMTWLHGYFFYDGIKRSWKWLRTVFTTSQAMHKILADVASLIRSVEELEQVVAHAQVLKSCKVQEHFQKITSKSKRSKKMREFIGLLKTSTFNQGGTLLHRRGRVLHAHNLLKEIKNELVPALQAIAEFDAYLSLAKLVKEYQSKPNQFTFATFATEEKPLINLDDCWIDGKMIASDNVVSNNTKFGNGHARHALITGPNGGGKSTYLKSLGQAVCMAQGWGIVAAHNAQLTLFTGIRTSLDPREDMVRGISTFMAQKERIKLIEDFMVDHQAYDKYLVMLDEPYRGTTDDESADRIWQFGKRIAQMPHCVTLIATHVKKPIELAENTNGAFANFQVEIEEPLAGQFKRTFKIKPGAAMWWFNNASRRSRFVDWLDEEIKRQAEKKPVFDIASLLKA